MLTLKRLLVPSAELIWIWLLRGLGLALLVAGILHLVTLGASPRATAGVLPAWLRGVGFLLAGGMAIGAGASFAAGGALGVGLALWAGVCVWHLRDRADRDRVDRDRADEA